MWNHSKSRLFLETCAPVQANLWIDMQMKLDWGKIHSLFFFPECIRNGTCYQNLQQNLSRNITLNWQLFPAGFSILFKNNFCIDALFQQFVWNSNGIMQSICLLTVKFASDSSCSCSSFICRFAIAAVLEKQKEIIIIPYRLLWVAYYITITFYFVFKLKGIVSDSMSPLTPMDMI